MSCKQADSFESVFFKVLGLSLYIQSNSKIFQTLRLKVFSLGLGLSLLVLFILANIVLNVDTETQFFAISELFKGNFDTISGSNAVNYFVNLFSATCIYLAALFTEDTFVQILNRINRIREEFPIQISNQKPKIQLDWLRIIFTINIAIIILAFIVSSQKATAIWAVLYVFEFYVVEVISFRQLAMISLISSTISYVNLTINGPNKKLFEFLEQSTYLLDDFQRINQIKILILSGRLLITNVAMIYSTNYLCSHNLLDLFIGDILSVFARSCIINIKFMLLTYYCEKTTENIYQAMRLLAEMEGAKINVGALHYSKKCIQCFGLFTVDRKLSFMVSMLNE